jgi:hypothetical protein
MPYGLFADLVEGIHVVYVSVVVLGFAAILLGGIFGWQWVRNRWFRSIHLLMIAVVALQAVFNLDCPLTVWGDQLRILAGRQVAGGTFVGRLMHDLIHFDAPRWVFDISYILFAAIVLGSFWLVPVRWRARSQPAVTVRA